MYDKRDITSEAKRAIILTDQKVMRSFDADMYALLLFHELLIEGGLPQAVISGLGNDVEDVRRVIAKQVPRSAFRPFAPIDEILTSAMRFVEAYGHHYVGREHLLAALFEVYNVGKNPVLSQFSLSRDDIKGEIRAILGIAQESDDGNTSS